MSAITTYKCDKCGATSDKKSGFLHSVKLYIDKHHGGMEFRDLECDLCNECLKGFGCTPLPPKEARETPVPTIEDLIREIVRQEQP